MTALATLATGALGAGVAPPAPVPAPPDEAAIQADAYAHFGVLRTLLEAAWGRDRAFGAAVIATNVRGEDPAFAAANAVDGRADTAWATDDGVTAATLTLELAAPAVFDRIVLEEAGPGGRVESFSVEVRAEAGWTQIARGTAIGAARVLPIAAVTTRHVRLNVLAARAGPVVRRVSLFAAPPRVAIETPVRAFMGELEIVLVASRPDAVIHYTLDGRPPGPAAPRYAGPMTLARSATLRASAVAEEGSAGAAVEATFRRYTEADLRPAIVFIRAPDPGLRYAYHEGEWTSVDDVENAAPVAEGTVAGFDLGVRRRDERFALAFRGFIDVPEDGLYEFTLVSDDGSRLRIGDEVVVDNDGLHPMTARSGVVGLRAGYHPIAVTVFNATGAAGLEVKVAGPGTPSRPVPPSMLFR